MNLRQRRGDLAALAVMSLAVAGVYGRVLFTNLTPAAGDFLFYFVPYWDQVNFALSAGRLPLWNPYLFAGAPFLANLQASVFYPLRWLFVLIPAAKGIVFSAALHAWLTGAFGYALARRVGGVSPLAALVAGLVLALNGWATGLLAHPNRAATLPWLLAALVAWESVAWEAGWGVFRSRRDRRWLLACAMFWALALLAGHSQTFYNQAAIFALWVLMAPVWRLGRSLAARVFNLRRAWNTTGPAAAALVALFSLAVLASAVQLLPTYELSGLSFRSGGLPYRDHAALSLPPWRLGFALLPHYARDLGRALATDAYGEWVAYVGVAGLALAAVGTVSGLSRRLRLQALALVVIGIVLAFGAYTPLDYVLYRLAPGWSFFRVPARWLQASVLGLALLASLGMERLLLGWRPRSWLPLGRLGRAAAACAGLAIAALALLTRPNLGTWAGWGLALLALGLAWVVYRRASGRWRFVAAALVVFVLLVELYAASWVLPIQHPTAPQAITSWRTAPTRIAAEMAAAGSDAASCRTLSLSDTTYDPGDLADLRTIYGPFLDERSFADLIAATKAKEVLAPNLSMLARLPSLDGFDGGLLPTRTFVQAMGLFLAADEVVADGRLREQLHEVPDARLLSLFHVCYVITDKSFDVWQDGVYYDLAFGESLTAEQPNLPLGGPPGFPLTAVGIVSHIQGGAGLPDGTPVAELVVGLQDGGEVTVPIRAGLETFEGADAAAGLTHSRDLPAVRWRYDASGQDAIARLHLPESGQPVSLRLHLLRPDVQFFVRGLALIDEVSSAHATTVVSRHPWTRIHSGDVKVYRNDGVLPRAFLVGEAEVIPDDAATLARLRDPGFHPDELVLLAAGDAADGIGSPAAAVAGGEVTWLASGPETLRLTVSMPGPGWLVLADAWYPGWVARGDGVETLIHRADLLLRAVPLAAGDHTVDLQFEPSSLRWGIVVTLLAVIVLIVLFLL